jgi:hypothetical protein
VPQQTYASGLVPEYRYPAPPGSGALTHSASSQAYSYSPLGAPGGAPIPSPPQVLASSPPPSATRPPAVMQAELQATILPAHGLHMAIPPPSVSTQSPPPAAYLEPVATTAVSGYPAHLWQVPPPPPPPDIHQLYTATSCIYPPAMVPMGWPGQVTAFMLPACPPPALPSAAAPMKRKSHYEELGPDMYKRQRLCTGN